MYHRLLTSCHANVSREPSLQQSMEYCIVFRDCCEVLPTQECLEGCPIHDIPLAVHVPMNPEEMVPEGAFAGVPRLRHVSVEPGIRFVGAEAWQCCRQLRIVKMPATVVGIADNAFRGCQLLSSVTAPGCREFGCKAFAECSSLQWVYAAEGVANQFCSTTKFALPVSRLYKPPRFSPARGFPPKRVAAANNCQRAGARLPQFFGDQRTHTHAGLLSDRGTCL